MRFVREETGNADLNSYAPLYHFSIDQPTLFWTLLWDFVGIRASGERDPVLIDDDGMAVASWFPGVSLNFAQNLLRFDDERIAIRCHDTDGEHEPVTYGAIAAPRRRAGRGNDSAGVQARRPVAALLPNVPDALVAMLASASLGAIWFACPSASDAGATGVAGATGAEAAAARRSFRPARCAIAGTGRDAVRARRTRPRAPRRPARLRSRISSRRSSMPNSSSPRWPSTIRSI